MSDMLSKGDLEKLKINLKKGWENYSFFPSEPHVIMLRRKIH